MNTHVLLKKFLAAVLTAGMVLNPAAVRAGLPNVAPAAPLSGAAAGSMPFVQGVTVFPQAPLEMDFLLPESSLFKDRERLEQFIRYFLAALTIPAEKLWVNLSPVEPDRIMDEETASTDLGRGLLEQDYVLKRMSAALTHPDTELGKKYWEHIYTRAYEDFGTTDIPLDGAQKVWIVPGDIEIRQGGATAIIHHSRLKVLAESEYLKAERNDSSQSESFEMNVLPVLEQEVNECDEFQMVRDIFHASILAVWYKNHLRQEIWNAYIDRNKIEGIDTSDPQERDRIFHQYLEMFRSGLYDLIKDDYDPLTQSIESRRYFSGGLRVVPAADQIRVSPAMLTDMSLEFSAARVEFAPLDAAMLNAKSLKTWVALAAFAGVMMFSSVQGFAQSAGMSNPEGPWLGSAKSREGIVLSRDYGRVQRPEQTNVYSVFKANPKVFDLVKSHVSKDDVKSAIEKTAYDAFQKKQLKDFVDQNYSSAFSSGRYSVMDEWMVFAAQGKLGLVQDGDLGPVTEKTIFAKWGSTSLEVPAPAFDKGSGGAGSGSGGAEKDSLMSGGSSLSGFGFSLTDDNDMFSVDTNDLASEAFMPVVHLHEWEEDAADSRGTPMADSTKKVLPFGFGLMGGHAHGGSAPPPPPKLSFAQRMGGLFEYQFNTQAGFPVSNSSIPGVYDAEGRVQLNLPLNKVWRFNAGFDFFSHKFVIDPHEHEEEEEHEPGAEPEEHEEHEHKLVETVPFLAFNLQGEDNIEFGLQLKNFLADHGHERWVGSNIAQTYFWGKADDQSFTWNLQPWWNLAGRDEHVFVSRLDLSGRFRLLNRLYLSPVLSTVMSEQGMDFGFSGRLGWEQKDKSLIFLSYSSPVMFKDHELEEALEPVMHQHSPSIVFGKRFKNLTEISIQWRDPLKDHQSVTAGVSVPLRPVVKKKVSGNFRLVEVSHGNHMHYQWVPVSDGEAADLDLTSIPRALRPLAMHPELGEFSLGRPVQKQIGTKSYWGIEYHHEHWSFILLGHLKDYLATFPQHSHEEEGHDEHMEPLLHVIQELMEESPEYFELPETYDENMFVPVPSDLQSLDLTPYFNGQEGSFRAIKDENGWRVIYVMRLGANVTRYTPAELLEHLRSQQGSAPILAVVNRLNPDGYFLRRSVSMSGDSSVPARSAGGVSEKAQLADYGGIDLTGLRDHPALESSLPESRAVLQPGVLRGMTFRIVQWSSSITLGEYFQTEAVLRG